MALVLVAVIVAAVVVNIWLERMIVFTVPLAVIVFVLSGLLTLALTRLSGAAANLAAAVCLIAAVAVGWRTGYPGRRRKRGPGPAGADAGAYPGAYRDSPNRDCRHATH